MIDKNVKSYKIACRMFKLRDYYVKKLFAGKCWALLGKNVTKDRRKKVKLLFWGIIGLKCHKSYKDLQKFKGLIKCYKCYKCVELFIWGII